MTRRSGVRATRPGALLLVLLLVVPLAVADEQSGPDVPSGETGGEPGWPQFRGPRRDGVSGETGLLQRWPEGGPKLLWSVSGLGNGYSSPVVVPVATPVVTSSDAKGTLYVTGDIGRDLVISAFDLDGKPKWRTTNGRSWRGPWPGSRASCTYSGRAASGPPDGAASSGQRRRPDQARHRGGRLYHMNAHGRAVCLDAADGRELWAVNVLERFEAKNIKWGISECLLVVSAAGEGERVIVTPGGRKAFMAALDTDTGETVWASEPLHFDRTHRFGGERLDPPVPDTDKAGYASPILFELGGRRLIAGCSARHLFCVDAEAGKLGWTHPVWAQWEVIGTIPVFWRDSAKGSVFFTVPDKYGGRLFRVHAAKSGPRRGPRHAGREGVRFEQLWETPLDNCHGALVLVDGRLYGSGYRRVRGWACIDAESGKMVCTRRDLAKGSVIYADGRLYVLSEAGIMALLKPTSSSLTATGFETAGQFRVTQRGRRDCWAHPAVTGGRLYLRCHDTLYCYDIKEKRDRPHDGQ